MLKNVWWIELVKVVSSEELKFWNLFFEIYNRGLEFLKMFKCPGIDRIPSVKSRIWSYYALGFIIEV